MKDVKCKKLYAGCDMGTLLNFSVNKHKLRKFTGDQFALKEIFK